MNVKIIERQDHRLRIVRLEPGEAIVTTLAGVVRGAGVVAGRITGRGRVSRLTVMRPPAGDAVTLPAPGDILWMEGDVVREGNESSVVLHALVALPDGSVAGGRVAEATADSFEITIEESPLLPPRVVDPGTGGAFVDLSAGEERRGPDGRATSGVDEVVEDSFPASDPPSFAGVPSD